MQDDAFRPQDVPGGEGAPARGGAPVPGDAYGHGAETPASAQAPTAGQPDSSGQGGVARTSRAARLRELLLAGTSRFPVVAVLTAVMFAIGVLMCFDLLPGIAGGGLLGIFLEGSVFDDGVSQLARTVYDLREACGVGALVAVVAQLAAERRGKERHEALRWQIAGGIAGVFASLGLALLGNAFSHQALASLARDGICLAALSLMVWELMGNANERTLVPKLTCVGVYAGLVTSVLLVGLCICILAAEVLVFGDGGPLDQLYGVTLELCGVLLFPNLFCALLPRHGEELHVSRLYQALVGYVVVPLCLVLLGVLYAYIAKIVATWSMPAGEMNWFGSFALLVYLYLWASLRGMTWKPAKLFVRWGWALLVPVVAVQLVGIAIRLQAYGLTTSRYAGLLCLGVGIAGLVFAALDRPPRWLFAVAGAAALVGTLTPANVLDVPNIEQTLRLRGALAQEGLLGEDGLLAPAPDAMPSDESAERIASSWEYLRWARDGFYTSDLVADLRQRADDKGFEELFGFPKVEGGEDDRSRWVDYNFSFGGQGVDVSGFSRVYDLNLITSGDVYALSEEDGYQLTVAWDDETSVSARLAPLVGELMRGHEGWHAEEGFVVERGVEEADLRLDVGEGRVLALTNLRVSSENGVPTTVSVEGYLLVP